MCFSSHSSFIIIVSIVHGLVHAVQGINIPFDEKVGYQIQWAGRIEESDIKELQGSDNVISITTQEKEQYHCVLPEIEDEMESDKEIELFGPHPFGILQRIFSGVICTLKMEQFWTYELCHGHFVRQYHKDIPVEDAGKLYREYILGKFDLTTVNKEEVNSLVALSPRSIKKVSVDGKLYPYYAFNMTDGAICDIHGRHRFTNVMYICDLESYNEIHSIKETSICEYEMIVFSPLLCEHPAFRLSTPGTKDINCYAVGNSPIKPSQLTAKQNVDRETFKPPREEKKRKPSKDKLPYVPNRSRLVNDFLTGKYCLQGGTGWWMYEFCYGKNAVQFHEEKGARNTIILGKWDIASHLAWLTENPHKKHKKGESKQISHMYTGGSFCEETGKNRRVEVKLKCIAGKINSNSISMYLLEPKPCEYVLPIESPIFCPVIEAANEFGLI